MSGRRRAALAGLVAVLLAAAGIYELVASRTSSTGESPSATRTSRSPAPVEVSRRALAGARFPARRVRYPTRWPHALRFPREFVPVRAEVGGFGGGPAYASALRRHGSARAAAAAVVAFFGQRGWRVVRRTALSSGGYVLTIAGSAGRESASVTIEPDVARPRITRVVAAVLT